MKRVWKESDEFDAEKHVCNKLLYLFIDAMKFLGSTLTAEEMLAASFEAHEADFDAYMTSKVFEAMIQFSDQASKAVETVETTTNVTVTVTVESELVTVKTNQTKRSKKRKSGNNPELVYVFC